MSPAALGSPTPPSARVWTKTDTGPQLRVTDLSLVQVLLCRLIHNPHATGEETEARLPLWSPWGGGGGTPVQTQVAWLKPCAPQRKEGRKGWNEAMWGVSLWVWKL